MSGTRVTLVLILAGAVLSSGCGRKKDSSPQPQSPLTSSSSPALNDPVDEQLAVAEAAQRAGELPAAVEALTTLRRARLNSRQAAAYGAQMQSLQRSVASAVESGDVKAKQASERLRQSAAMR